MGGNLLGIERSERFTGATLRAALAKRLVRLLLLPIAFVLAFAVCAEAGPGATQAVITQDFGAPCQQTATLVDGQVWKYSAATGVWSAGSASGPPIGPAGGDLGGTYPNPTVVNLSHVTTGMTLQAAYNGGASGTASGVIVETLAGGPLALTQAVGANGLTVTGGTQTTSQPIFAGTQTWNAGGVAFRGMTFAVTNTASAADSRLLNLTVGAFDVAAVRKDGAIAAFGDLWAAGGSNGVFTDQGTVHVNQVAQSASNLTINAVAASVVLESQGGATQVVQFVGFDGLQVLTSTQTANHPAFAAAQTWNNGATVFQGSNITITNTASAAGSYALKVSGSVITSPDSGTNSERFGLNSAATGTSDTAVGNGASATGSSNSTVVGQGATDNGNRNVTIFGQGAAASGIAEVIIGNGATASGTSATSIGSGCQASGSNVICIGDNGVVVSANNAIGIGSNVGFGQCISLGRGQAAANQVAAAHQFAIGSDSANITTTYLGRGFSSTTPDATVTLSATGGSGAAVAGSALALSGGLSGDAATAGGELDFQVALAGTGTTRTTTFKVSNAGHLLAGADNTYDIGAVGASRPRNVYIAGKLTVAGAIDPTSVSLSSGTALFFDSADGSTAPLSAAAHGRIRYNDSTHVWELSANGGAYATIATGSGSQTWSQVLASGKATGGAGTNDPTITSVSTGSGSGNFLTFHQTDRTADVGFSHAQEGSTYGQAAIDLSDTSAYPPTGGHFAALYLNALYTSGGVSFASATGTDPHTTDSTLQEQGANGVQGNGALTYLNASSTKCVTFGDKAGPAGNRGYTVARAGGLAWSNSSTDSTTAVDTAIQVKNAGVILLGNGTDGDTSANLQLGQVTKYNGVTTAGIGVASVVGYGRQTGQTGSVATVATFTPGADGSFEVSVNINMTAFTAGSLQATCSYTDESGTSRAQVMPFLQFPSGLLTTTLSSANPANGFTFHIRAQGTHAITISTTATAFTGTYNVEAKVTQFD